MIVLLLTAAPSFAATLAVDRSGGATYESIQDAIDAASSGDTITVAAGTYAECIDTSGKDLSIEGADVDDVTLNPRGVCTNAISVLSGETVSISGMEIRNGSYRAVYAEDSDLYATGATVDSAGCSFYGNSYGSASGGPSTWALAAA